MKYFNEKWWSGNTNYIEEINRKFEAYYDSIKDIIKPSIRDIFDYYDFHDELITNINVNYNQKMFTVKLEHYIIIFKDVKYTFIKSPDTYFKSKIFGIGTWGYSELKLLKNNYIKYSFITSELIEVNIIFNGDMIANVINIDE